MLALEGRNTMDKKKEYSQLTIMLLALIPMALWGSLFPMVKIGYQVCRVNTGSTADIMMYAGTRFAVCGLVTCFITGARREKMAASPKKGILPILLSALFSVVLHYSFTYVGLSMSESSKASILKQLGALFYICFSFLFFKEEKINRNKLLGAFLGFSGILAINAGGSGGAITLGDGLLIAASVCSVVASVISKSALKYSPPLVVTGVSQLAGGAALMVISGAMGGRMPYLGWSALPAFAYICFASTVASLLWNVLVQKGVLLSRLFIIKFSEPVFSCVFSAVLLGENILKWQYLAAFTLISLGIVISQRSSYVSGQGEKS